MAVAPLARSFGTSRSKKRAGGMEGGGGLKKGAKGGGGVVQADGIGSGKGGSFSMGLRWMFSCFMRPITTDDAVPKLVTVGHDRTDDFNIPQSQNLKVRVRDETKLENCRERVVDDDQPPDVEENYLSAREDVEGSCSLRFFTRVSELDISCMHSVAAIGSMEFSCLDRLTLRFEIARISIA